MKKISVILLALFSMTLSSCGDEEKKETITIGEESTLEPISTAETDPPVEENAIQREDGVVEVVLKANDQMQFNLEEIKVKEGQTVRLTLQHVGELSEQVMGHNFVLLEDGTDVTDFAQRAAAAADNEYVPEGAEDVIVKTEMIGGGEEVTIEFQAPDEGIYDFICSFPGHWVQMRGKFIVEDVEA